MTDKIRCLAMVAPGTAEELRQTRRLCALKSLACDTIEELLLPLVLIVDDDAEFRDLLRAHLQSSRQCRTMVAHGPQAALDVIRQQRVAMVISDLQMPIMTGVELLQRIQQEWPEIVRVLMSAGGPDTHPDGKLGAWYVRKHPEIHMMVETVLELLPAE